MKKLTVTYRKGHQPGPMATEWWDEKDWEKWDKHVKELKESGEYGKEEEATLYLKENKMLDQVEEGIIIDMDKVRLVILDPIEPK